MGDESNRSQAIFPHQRRPLNCQASEWNRSYFDNTMFKFEAEEKTSLRKISQGNYFRPTYSTFFMNGKRIMHLYKSFNAFST